MNITVGEYHVTEEFGWVFVHDGDGVTQLTLPKDVWIELCVKTLKSEDRGV